MMSAQPQIFENDDVVLGGVAVPPSVRPGQIDPRGTHYAYSAGEKVLKVRPRDVGYSAIYPGFLVPLRPFRVNVPNDTLDSLFNKEAPQNMEIEVLPRDQADALMSRYQHRGVRILFPLTSMNGPHGERRAAELFSIVHPKLTCPRNPKLLQRQCVFCRMEQLADEEALVQRIEKTRITDKPHIIYGLDDNQSVRLISDLEALEIMRGLITSANTELYAHMMDTLAQSKADVEAGKHGPGKKKYDKRDEWYFLNTHTVPEEIQAMENAKATGVAMAGNVSQIVAETIKAVSGGGTSADMKAMLDAQEKRHQAELKAQEERLMKLLQKTIKDNKNNS